MPNPNQSALEAATIYLLPEHQIILDELKLKLRRAGTKVTKSQLVRLAIHRLIDEPLEKISDRLNTDLNK